MRFVDFLRAAVLLCAACASLLAALCVVGASAQDEGAIVLVSAAWWAAATAIGLWLGRHAAITSPISRLLANARAATMMPEHRPLATMLNRLWPLLVCTTAAGIAAVFAPQVAGVATGFAIIWSLAWRRQDRAVEAIEERDGVTFFVGPTSPIEPMTLERIPGFRRETPTVPSAG